MVGAICSKNGDRTFDTWAEGLFPRLVQEPQYSSTFAEIEVALKMKLVGFAVSFGQPTSDSPSPDLHITEGSFLFNIEVSSLNPPDAHQRMIEFQSRIMASPIGKRVTVGGIISNFPFGHGLQDLISVSAHIKIPVRYNYSIIIDNMLKYI